MTGSDDTGAGVAASSGPTLAGFVRARLDDLRDSADAFHRADPFSPCNTVRLLPGVGCDCDEPNRRRRRALTHGNLVDWAEQAVGVTDDDGVAVLCHLAAEWSDHPDYLTEWAP